MIESFAPWADGLVSGSVRALAAMTAAALALVLVVGVVLIGVVRLAKCTVGEAADAVATILRAMRRPADEPRHRQRLPLR